MDGEEKMTETTDRFRPFLTMALFCEKALQEKDGVLSLIRIIDQWNVVGTAERLPPTNLRFTTALSFKSGFVRGKYSVRIKPKTPSGKELPAIEVPVFFEGEDRGVNLLLETNITLHEEGIYWFDVFFEDEVVTSVPLRLLYHRSTGMVIPPTG
jgi:hypothetical protein